MKPSVLIVVPTYNHFEYAAEAIASAFTSTSLLDAHVLMVDDASPEWPTGMPPRVFLSHLDTKDRETAEDKFHVHHFGKNGGLTRSWNYGLREAKRLNFDYCLVTNSDVYFPPNWEYQLVSGLKQYDLVGPVTNAPGTVAEQYVKRYSMTYDTPKSFVFDPAGEIETIQKMKWQQALYEQARLVALELFNHQNGKFKEVTVNGFCMMAKTKTWWEHAFDAEHVFRPRNDFNSKGEPNPTPLMTLNEYELQHRWHQKGLKSAACLGSYVFHYRAVTRGDREKRGDWVRKEGA